MLFFYIDVLNTRRTEILNDPVMFEKIVYFLIRLYFTIMLKEKLRTIITFNYSNSLLCFQNIPTDNLEEWRQIR